MAESMVVELQLKNLTTVLGGLRQVASAVASINGVMSKAKNSGVMIQQATINALTITGGNITINQKGGGSGTGGGTRAPKSPASFMERLNKFFASSRFSVGGGGGSGALMPLVGQALNLIGPAFASLAGPIGAVVGGFALMYSAADSAAKAITAFRDSMIVSGGTTSETALMGAIGKLGGISDMAGAARTLADKLGTDGAAAAFGQQAGGSDNSSAWSKMDKATNLLKFIDHIVSLKTPDAAAARFARVEGLEWALKFRDASEGMYENFKKSALLINPVINNPDNKRNAANFDIEQARMSMAWEGFITRIGARLMPGLTSIVGAVANILEKLNGWMDRLSIWWDRLMGKKDTPAANNSALDRNTRAHEDNTQALKSGVYGGGERARGAVPSAWGGMNAKNWGPGTGQAALLGAFNI